jgi:hypothetical protein
MCGAASCATEADCFTVKALHRGHHGDTRVMGAQTILARISRRDVPLHSNRLNCGDNGKPIPDGEG